MVVETMTLGNVTMPGGAVPSGGHGPMSHVDNRGALFMGVVYGLVHAIGPDHLGTLMTLSSVTTPGKAFRVGGAWGLGHSFGMVSIAAIFLLARKLITVDMEKWEHYGNYFIGASMMACAIYFMISESTFLKEQADGTVVAQGCACHGGGSLAPAPSAEPAVEAEPALPMCGDCGDVEGYGASGGRGLRRFSLKENFKNRCREPCCEDEEDHTCPALEVAETQPLLTSTEKDLPEASAKAESWLERTWAGRDAKGAVLGVFQGLCCPLGMLGVTFLANLPSIGIAIFLIVFMCISAFGTALMAVLWAYLTAYGCSSRISPRFVYRASCGFTLLLGAVWIICNHFGWLEMLDYAEGMVHH